VSLKIQIAVAVILTVIAGFVVFCFFYPLVTVSGLELIVEGETVLSDTVCSMCEIENLFRQPLESFANQIADERPELSSVSCRIGLNGHVICTAKLKRPVVYIAAPEIYGLTRDYELLPLSNTDNVTALPVISGLSVKGGKFFEPIDSPDLKRAVDLIDAMNDASDRLSRGVSQIEFRDGDATVLYIRDSEVRVILGAGEYSEKFVYLDLIFDKLKGLPAGEVDMRFGRSIIVRNLNSKEV